MSRQVGRQDAMSVAHELKNALSGVKALAQLGLRNPAEAPSHPRLARIEAEVARVQDVLRQRLSPERHRMRRARVDVGALVRDALAALAPRAAGARVLLSARGGGHTDGDPFRLGEVLLNLVGNAIEATPAGGEVVVDVQPVHGGIEIVVRDTGRGMPPETLRRIGTPFFTTREVGTGLGVALARAAVALHGGTTRYESEQGRGTTVTVTLPADG